MEIFWISLLNGLSYGLLLFLLSSGLTLIFSVMGVLNFAHASFYMLGAYFAYALTPVVGFVPALLLAPLLVGMLGMGFAGYCLRRVQNFGHIAELLITFGLSYILSELVQLIWGRTAVDYRVPPFLEGALFTLYQTQFPKYKAFMMLVSIIMLLILGWGLKKTRLGLVIQAAQSHPQMLQALGHNVPLVMTLVFGGASALAGLAGVIGGNALITEPGMALSMGSLMFVVVVIGGLGSLEGAFLASLLIGILQTFAVAIDGSVLSLLATLGITAGRETFGYALWKLKVSECAPVLPYLLLVLTLILRPRGLLGSRNT